MNDKIKDYYNIQFHHLKSGPLDKMKKEVRFALLKKLLQFQKENVLIIGCGSQGEMGILNKNCKGLGVDLSETAIKQTKRDYPKFKYYVCDATNLPMKDNQFDCVVCSEVMEHIPNQQKLLKEIKRVLKRKGLLLLTTPNWLSWYGLARIIAEFIFKKPFTADNQPVDNWQIPYRLKRILARDFKIVSFQGLWYYPPTGKERFRIPDLMVLPLFWLFYPIELLLRKILPWFGHMMVFKASLK